MPVRYAIERRKWSEAAQLEPVTGTQPHVAAITAWARAIGLARGGNPAAARRELDHLEGAFKKLRESGDDYWASQVHVQSNEAVAWIAYAEGKKDDGLKLMRAAADEEDAVEKRPVTPGAIVPAREQLGDMLLESNRAPEALNEIEKALTMAPQRRGALMGQARARQIVVAEKS
jgi:tetratricopeptide (TPR) repeat protein